ncbi:MAG: hypothetical protein CM15mV12_2270 [uncultured marine virus]|nr:MAG: hypothetical protein CM15mV12_2270 [uncultured marine virus]
MEIFSTFVRLGILIWSGGILTLNYVAIPNFPQKNIDPTFIASVFTGVLGLASASRQQRIKMLLVVEMQIYLRKTWSS